MLCVLREDFLLELRGIVGDDFGHLDDNDIAFRQLYFWRNSLRTLTEIQAGLNRLNKEPAFRAAMACEPADIREAFEELKRALNKAAAEFLRDLRNTFGGHLDPTVFQATLDQMDPLREGLLDLERKRGEIHYKFTAELLWAALVRDAPAGAEVHAFETLLSRSVALNPMLVAIDHVVTCYIRDRGLFRSRR